MLFTIKHLTEFDYRRVNMNHARGGVLGVNVRYSPTGLLGKVGVTRSRQDFPTCREPVLKCLSFNCKAFLPCLKQAGGGMLAGR